MSVLKLEDLMVGDWVNVRWEMANCDDYYPPTPCVVKGIIDEGGGSSHTYMAKDINEDMLRGCADLSKLSPIPLTPEILKKNGFKCVAVGDSGPATPKRNYMRYEKWVLCTQWRDVELFFDRLTKRYKLQGCNGRTFTEVHILQHALRFLNIDKEITL